MLVKKVVLFSILLLFFACSTFSQQIKIDSLTSLINKNVPDSQKVKALNQLTEIYLTPITQNYKTALGWALKAKELSEKIKSDRGAYFAHKNLGIIYSYFSIYDKAVECNMTQLKFAKKINDSNLIFEAHQILAFGYYIAGYYDKSLIELDVFENWAQSTKDVNKIIAALWLKARTFTRLSQSYLIKTDSAQANIYYSKAIDNYLKALQYSEKMADTGTIIALYCSLGYLYDFYNIPEDEFSENVKFIRYNYLSKALDANFHALKLASKINDSARMIDCYYNLALYYRNQGNQFLKKNNHPFSQKNYQLSLEYFLKILKIIEHLGYPHGIANYNRYVGSAYAKLNNYDKAIYHLSKAVKGFETIGYNIGKKEGYKELTDVYVKNGDFENAFYAFLEFSKLKDSAINESVSKQLIEMDMKYETEKKADSIRQQKDLVYSKNEFIKKQNSYLWILAFLSIVSVLLLVFTFLQSKKISRQYQKIVHLQNELTHRAGNYFNMVKNMLASAQKSTTDKATIQAIENRVHTLNQLFKKLQYNGDNGSVSFEEIMDSIFADFDQWCELNKKITVHREIAISLRQHQIMPLAFIIVELFTNAQKHAFTDTEQPEINLKLYETQGQKTLLYTDNGKGCDFATNGNDKIQHGVQIIKGYCKALNGKIETWNEAGFHFKMTFKNG